MCLYTSFKILNIHMYQYLYNMDRTGSLEVSKEGFVDMSVHGFALGVEVAWKFELHVYRCLKHPDTRWSMSQ